jgi:tetratricopeptide (TPR) repeat protein
MAQATPLAESIFNRIDTVFGEAKAALASGDLVGASEASFRAWAAVPEPKYGWDFSYVLLNSLVTFARPTARRREVVPIVEGYLASEFYLDYQEGPWFWLGTIYFEEGDMLRAFENFERAVSISRGRCFREEDPKYRRFYEETKRTKQTRAS